MNACTKKYSTNFSDTRAQLSMMPGVYNSDANTLTFFATNPFLILGLLDIHELPTGEVPNYPNSKFTLRSAAIQNTNSQMLQALFIAMGFANAQPTGVSNGMTAYFAPDSGFAEYMYRYLNPSILGGWYNTYIMPSSKIIQFWADRLAIADAKTDMSALQTEAAQVFNNSALNLFNPPGAYIIDLGVGNTEPYIADLKTYLASTTNTIYLIVQQQNSPDLVDNGNISPNPLANTINSINFAGNVPDAILWK